MLELLKNEANMTHTENGALAFRSTGAACLDLFASCGALRRADKNDIICRFIRAYTENPDIAMRILFYSRDIRDGLGERRIFKIITRYLANFRPQSVLKNLRLFAEYGRYDDILVLLGTSCEDAVVNLIKEQLRKDIDAAELGEGVSLLAKWLPSVNTSSQVAREQAKLLCRRLDMSEKEYRKTLSALRKHIGIVEDNLRRKDYSFKYENLPGKALFKYSHAMLTNDGVRYKQYLDNVDKGTAKMNTNTLYPYEIVSRAIDATEADILKSLDTTWNALPDYTDSRNALAVIDGSASMYSSDYDDLLPITIAISLGIYFAERNRGYFRNYFITFSETPQLVKIKGDDISKKVYHCMSYNEVENTDLFKVFMLILKTAVKHKLPQSELPELIYIISDMEFDSGVNEDKSVFEDAKKLFDKYGYHLPQIVYWNVYARTKQFPISMNEKGVALVSGASPTLFKQMMSMDMDPFSFMEKILESERYRNICA